MKLGFIGCGNMALAMMGGILKKGICAPGDIRAADVSRAALEKAEREYAVSSAPGSRELASWAEVLVLSVKPQFYESVIKEIRGCISLEQLVITIAPGKTLSWLTEQFQKPVRLVRAMPNTPALAGEGMAALCVGENVPEEQAKLAFEIFQSFGKAEPVPERLMDAVVAVSGSAPAYVFLMLEAMADAAVAEGMPRAQAYTFAAQAVLGSARLALETGKHPGELKDMVCSPAGTTIEAVRILEETGFRGSLMKAMAACAEKSRQL